MTSQMPAQDTASTSDSGAGGATRVSFSKNFDSTGKKGLGIHRGTASWLGSAAGYAAEQSSVTASHATLRNHIVTPSEAEGEHKHNSVKLLDMDSASSAVDGYERNTGATQAWVTANTGDAENRSRLYFDQKAATEIEAKKAQKAKKKRVKKLHEGMETTAEGVYTGQLTSSGKIQGRGTFEWNNGNRYEGWWHEGAAHGWGVFTWANGNRYEGEWRANERHGYGVLTTTSGSCYTGQFQKGLMSGLGRFAKADGSVFIGKWSNTHKDGDGLSRAASGETREETWIRGKLTRGSSLADAAAKERWGALSSQLSAIADEAEAGKDVMPHEPEKGQEGTGDQAQADAHPAERAAESIKNFFRGTEKWLMQKEAPNPTKEVVLEQPYGANIASEQWLKGVGTYETRLSAPKGSSDMPDAKTKGDSGDEYETESDDEEREAQEAIIKKDPKKDHFRQSSAWLMKDDTSIDVDTVRATGEQVFSGELTKSTGRNDRTAMESLLDKEVMPSDPAHKITGRAQRSFKHGAYDGELSGTGRPHGQGTMQFTNGDNYNGQWYNGVMEGRGEFLSAAGVRYLGDWKDGAQDGFGESTDQHGNVYRGDFVKGMMSGRGQLTSDDGDIYHGDWKDNGRHGWGVSLKPDGSFSYGQWDEDRKVGLFVRVAKDGAGTIEEYKTDGDLESTRPATEEEVTRYKAEIEKKKLSSKYAGKEPKSYDKATRHFSGTDALFRTRQDINADAVDFSELNLGFPSAIDHWINDRPGFVPVMENGKETVKYSSLERWLEEAGDDDGLPDTGLFVSQSKRLPDQEIKQPNGCLGTRETEEGTYSGEMSNEGAMEGRGMKVWKDGSKYIGEWSAGLAEGCGFFEWPGGSIYEGEWEKSMKHGYGRMVSSNGTIYEGQWESGGCHGEGRFYNSHTGETYEGEWMNGHKHGRGLSFRWEADVNSSIQDQSQRLRFKVGTFKGPVFVSEYREGAKVAESTVDYDTAQEIREERRAKRLGGLARVRRTVVNIEKFLTTGVDEGVEIYVKDDPEDDILCCHLISEGVYCGPLVKGKPEGTGKLTWWHGDTYTGEWMEGRAHGEGTYRWVNGDQYEGGWYRNKKHGRGTLKGQNGVVYSGQWQDGHMSGFGLLQLPNNTWFEGSFVGDEKDGQGIALLEDGLHYQEEWKAGKLTSQSQLNAEAAAALVMEAKATRTVASDKDAGKYSQAPAVQPAPAPTPGVLSPLAAKRTPGGEAATVRSTPSADTSVTVTVFPKGKTLDGAVPDEWKTVGIVSGKPRAPRIVFNRHDEDRKHGSRMFSEGSYVGQLALDGELDGKGCFKYATGEKYEGEYHRGKKQGFGKHLLPSGDEYCGQFKQDSRNGLGTLRSKDGTTFEGDWANNEMHGYGELVTKSEKYRGYWRNNTMHGRGIMENENGLVYQGAFYGGDWKDGQRSGVGRYRARDGNSYSGQWQDNKMHGKGKLMYANGSVYEGSFANGLADGDGQCKWSDGDHYVGQWKGDAREGHGMMTLANGDVYTGQWHMNMMHGRGDLRSADGSQYSGMFSYNHPVGPGTFVDGQGRKRFVEENESVAGDSTQAPSEASVHESSTHRSAAPSDTASMASESSVSLFDYVPGGGLLSALASRLSGNAEAEKQPLLDDGKEKWV